MQFAMVVSKTETDVFLGDPGVGPGRRRRNDEMQRYRANPVNDVVGGAAALLADD